MIDSFHRSKFITTEEYQSALDRFSVSSTCQQLRYFDIRQQPVRCSKGRFTCCARSRRISSELCFSNPRVSCALSAGLTSSQSVTGLEAVKWGHFDQLFIHNTQGIGGLQLWVLTSVHHSHFVFASFPFISSLAIPKTSCLRSSVKHRNTRGVPQEGREFLTPNSIKLSKFKRMYADLLQYVGVSFWQFPRVKFGASFKRSYAVLAMAVGLLCQRHQNPQI